MRTIIQSKTTNTLRVAAGSLLAALVLCLWPNGAFLAPAMAQDIPRLKVITTVFPAFDFARSLTGGLADVTLLLPPGAESHSYEPTPKDIRALEEADLLVFVGGESEHWVREVLASLGEEAPLGLAMMDCVPTKAEERTASMEAEAGTGSEAAPEMDEHVWTSPKNAQEIVSCLSRDLQRLSPSAEVDDRIEQNAQTYLGQLSQLDQAFAQAVAGGTRSKIIFGDRFPFRYLVDAYGLQYDAAFPGCSEDSEPSARTITALIREIQQDHIPVVFYIEFSNRKTAGILAEETGAKPLLMHSCHNVSRGEMDAGATYLSLMEGNVAALREALS